MRNSRGHTSSAAYRRPFGSGPPPGSDSSLSMPTTFFLGTEDEMDAIRGRNSITTNTAAPPCHPHSNIRHAATSKYKRRSTSVVSSAASSINRDCDAIPPQESVAPLRRPTPRAQPGNDYDNESYEGDSTSDFGIETLASLPPSEPLDVGDTDLQSLQSLQSATPSHHSPLHPFFGQAPQALSPTYSRFGTIASSSALSSSSSLGESLAATFSDYHYAASQADADAAVPGNFGLDSSQALNDMCSSNGASQFIMPTLTLPSRRPFTDVGKALGRIKILVAGSSATGKSSLIRATLESCTHIIHADPTKASGSPVSGSRPQPLPLCETCASSKPHPPWWTRVNSRRASSSAGPQAYHEELLDRNITFLEAPGFDPSLKKQTQQAMSIVSQSLTAILQTSSSLCESNDDADTVRILGGDESHLVSVVLYLVSPTGLTKCDVEFMKTLQPLTNVIPIISRSDTLSKSALQALKETVASSLSSAGIVPFTFQGEDLGSAPFIYSASSLFALEPDREEKLDPSDLSRLIDDIFTQDGASWLRHASAKKALLWCKSLQSQYSPTALQLRPYEWQLSSLSNSAHASPSGPGSNRWCSFDFDQTITAHRQSRIKIEPWARNLQRSLSNIRLPHRDQVLSEIDSEMDLARSAGGGALVQRNVVGSAGGARHGHRNGHGQGQAEGHRRQRSRAETPSMEQDPLGLLTTIRGIKYTGWSAVQMIGAVGLVGGGFSLGGLPSGMAAL
ncbi:hypothetical protein CFIMG_003336RA [Ceratocystis fimbriata CBS 114723]|uniref:Septin-type G domain-containing protein n=1 Tax=Ceratocystis fimbriata CBS 114723 TaxID=1035309 RepID=A0A2C5X2R8_9PEZI|nr:hypothetical protein CFIMG_003336RA [Ceratocystis fimbriata CBS 114723]